MTSLVTMYRPTGPEEWNLVLASGCRRWPPRLPEQPIFYPVANEQYAIEIARDWNVPSSGQGFVTRFKVRGQFMDAYPLKVVGAARHAEWWIPAGELERLNDSIVGLIELVHQFGGN
jgi:hypothetical protein